MKIRIVKDERWPDFSVVDGWGFDAEIDVHHETVKRWERVKAEYDKVQDEIAQRLDEAES